MALCRCKNDRPRNKEKYIHYVQPIGYPNTSSICGKPSCSNAGLIWLTKIEYDEFLNGRRIFDYASNVTKVKVEQV